MLKLLHAEDLPGRLHGAGSLLAHESDGVVGPYAEGVDEVACDEDTGAAETLKEGK